MRFSKNGCNGGGEKFLLEMEGSWEWGWWFYNGGMGNKWQRGTNEDPLCCLPALFQILPTPSPSFQSPPATTPTVLSIFLFLLLNGLSYHIRCGILLNYIMDLHMSSLGILVPEGPWCVFSATRCQLYWGLTHVVFYCCSDFVIADRNTQHTQGEVDWHTHINMYLHNLLCAHSSYLYYIKWLKNNYFPQCLFFSKMIHLWKSYTC